jgi:hypothetical protein
MPKTFYTELDIEGLHRQGVTSLVVNDDVVLTEVAREKAERLGIQLVQEHDTPPSAPMRPYISPAPPSKPAAKETPGAGGRADLRRKVREAVLSRLGNEVDPQLLETIINRVLDNVGIS